MARTTRRCVPSVNSTTTGTAVSLSVHPAQTIVKRTPPLLTLSADQTMAAAYGAVRKTLLGISAKIIAAPIVSIMLHQNYHHVTGGNGYCSHGCASGYRGDKCDIPCSTTCRQNETTNVTECRQTDGYCEAGCQSGWFSTQCDETCSVGCAAVNASVNAICRQDNGYCDIGCDIGLLWFTV